MAAKKPAAKRGASRYQAPAKQPIPGWVWLVCGLLIGAFIVFLTKLEPGRDNIKRDKPEATRTTTNSATKTQNKNPPTTTTPAQVKPKYDFYTLLPESEVIKLSDSPAEEPPAALSPEELAKADAARALAALSGQVPPALPSADTGTPAAIATTTAATAATAAMAATTQTKAPLTTQFFLQAGAFRKQADADKVRAQIILLGQSVQIEPGNVREETWYRVLVGPFASRDQLGQAQKTLASGGFSNLLLQQRQSR